MDSHERSRQLSLALVQQLESLAAAGVAQLPRPAARKNSIPPSSVAGVSDPGQSQEETALAAPASLRTATDKTTETTPPAVDPRVGLQILAQAVAACHACELSETRTQTVFGVGNPQATLCFLGEAPGADEDKQGEPFVGRAGQLLTKIIEACTLTRNDVYILNVLKCRPPNNRNPLPHEVKACRGFLNAQLDLIRPQYLCCLGSVAAQTLLETDIPIGRMRGKFFDYRGIQVMCTYHPAYLLRNPAAKKDVWEDMKTLMAKMGVELGR